MTEALLQAIWQHRLFSPLGLKTTDGQIVEVLSPGLLNQGAGPDFAQARLRIDGQELVGAVELHLEEAGWFQHGHHGTKITIRLSFTSLPIARATKPSLMTAESSQP